MTLKDDEGVICADNPFEPQLGVRNPLTIVVDNPQSWFVPHAEALRQALSRYGHTSVVSDASNIPNGNEIAFLLSCEKIVPADILARSQHNIVVHASDLPRGRGMSPMTWQVIEGRKNIPLRLFEAVPELDAGPVYAGWDVPLIGNELLPELQNRLGVAIIQLCESFVLGYPGTADAGKPQIGEPTRYRRRGPEDGRLDPHKTIAEQFNLLRTVDNDKYPAFFDHLGRRYIVKITTL